MNLESQELSEINAASEGRKRERDPLGCASLALNLVGMKSKILRKIEIHSSTKSCGDVLMVEMMRKMMMMRRRRRSRTMPKKKN